MIPARAVLRGLVSVGQSLSGTDRALRDTGHSIVLNAIELAHTVPVDSGTVRAHVIGYVDDQFIPPVGDNRRARHGPIERHTGAFVSVWVAGTFFRRQPYLYSVAGFGIRCIVIRIGAILTPAASRSGRVWAYLEWLLERS